MGQKKILNVLYQSNDNYAMVSGISIISLLENNKHLDEINVFYCNYEINKANIKRLMSITKLYKNASIKFIETSDYHQTFVNLKVKAWHGFYITWLKLLAFGDLDLKTDRVLFINGHTIINGALDDLLSLDFEDNIMALSYDCLINDHKSAIGIKSTDGYFNCGIMLVNQKKWKAEDITNKLKHHLRKKSDYVIADQDLCNVFFRNKIKLLSSTFNFSSAYYAYDLKRLLRTNELQPSFFYSYDELMANYYAPKIIHSLFGIQGRPWEEGNKHPQRYLWKKYIDMSPWKDAPRPQATRSLTWYLYDILPSSLFMRLYKVKVKSQFAK